MGQRKRPILPPGDPPEKPHRRRPRRPGESDAAYDLALLVPLVPILAAYISQRWVAEALGISEAYVRRIIDRLHEEGYAHSDFFGASAPRLRWGRRRRGKCARPPTEG